MWNEISERGAGSAESGGKAHLFGRGYRSLEMKGMLRWSRKTKGGGCDSNPQVPSSQFSAGYFASRIAADCFTSRVSKIVTV